MSFEDLINAFAKHVNVEVEIIDGTVSFEIDDMPVVVMDVPELDSVIVSGEIAEPPPQGLEQLYKVLLEANYNFNVTSGATLSLNSETGKIMLCRLIPTADADDEKFFRYVENFVNVMETWKKIIVNYRENGTSKAASPDAAGDGVAFDGLVKDNLIKI